MIHPIKIYGNTNLRKHTAPITQEYPQLNQLISDMFETMHKAKGIGLAASQIGIPIRLFIIEAHVKETKFDFKGVYINPKIIWKSENVSKHPEGCLSFPGIAGIVERPSEIEMEYYDIKWKKHKEKFCGWESRIIQHEYEHLEGGLFIDNLTTMWKSILAPALEYIKKGKIDVEYLIE